MAKRDRIERPRINSHPPSTVPFHDIARDRAQQRRFFAKSAEMRNRLFDEQPCLFARALQPHQRDERRLACCIVLVQRLAGQRFVALDIHDVVGNLEGEPDVARITA